MDNRFKHKLKGLIEFNGLPYRLRKELEKGKITKELLHECMYYLDSKHLVLAHELFHSLPDGTTYRNENNFALPRFSNRRWHEKFKRNFILAMDEKIKQHGDRADLARIIS